MKNIKGLTKTTVLLIMAGGAIFLGALLVAGYQFWYKPTYITSKVTEEESLVLLADSPHVQTSDAKSHSEEMGWWVRGDTEWAEFAFENVDTSNLTDDQLTLKLNLGVTNRLDGDENLDGVVDLTLNPYDGQNSINYMSVIFKNKNRELPIASMLSGGTYQTEYETQIDKKFVVNGALVIRIWRHIDSSKAPVARGLSGKVEIVTDENQITELSAPKGVYENDDPYTVHINIPTVSGDKSKVQPGVATLYGYKK